MTKNLALRPAASPSLTTMASGAKADRNRAVDFYRAIAMLAVAFGHWMAAAIGTDENGGLIAGNALESRPDMAWVSWIFQVMPLFFVVGGFSSAMSLDSHVAKQGRPQDWVVARLRRMVAPATVLAASWLCLVALAVAIDALSGLAVTPLVVAGAVGAAIPLWFLSNYTIDTAIAPYVLPLFRRSPRMVMGGGLALFTTLEGVRFLHLEGPLHYLPYLNWVLGWLLFQMMGFAWRDGLLPTGNRLRAVAGGLWASAILAVWVGPWPLAMVHFPGIDNSPTHPPSLALMLFGAAYASTALCFAPAVSSFLAGNKRAWSAVVAANSVALSVYLWHMAAAAIAGGLFYALGWLPTAEIGSTIWWVQKAPLLVASMVVLAGIVTLVSGVERRSLLAPRIDWNGGQFSMLATALVLSVGVKLWASPGPGPAVLGMVLVSLVWLLGLRPAPLLGSRQRR